MNGGNTLSETLRKMIAVLKSERQALAGLDLEAILGCAADKNALCGAIETDCPAILDEECRGLAEAARHLNEVNRQIRNLVAANISARLEALTGGSAVYRAPGTAPYRYARGYLN